MQRTNRENHIVMSFLSSTQTNDPRPPLGSPRWSPILLPTHEWLCPHLACRCSEFPDSSHLSVPPRPHPSWAAVSVDSVAPCRGAGVMTRGPAACCLLHPTIFGLCCLHADWCPIARPLLTLVLWSQPFLALQGPVPHQLSPLPIWIPPPHHLPPPPPKHLFVFPVPLLTNRERYDSLLLSRTDLDYTGSELHSLLHPLAFATAAPLLLWETAVPLVTNNIHLPNYLDIIQFILLLCCMELCDYLLPACTPQILCDALHYKFCCHFGHTFEPAKAKLDSTFGLVFH